MREFLSFKNLEIGFGNFFSYVAFNSWDCHTYGKEFMKEWLNLSLEPSVVKRSLRVALVVGAILIAINYWDVILNGKITTTSVLKMALTVLVPYFVSTFASVGALRESRRQESRKQGSIL